MRDEVDAPTRLLFDLLQDSQDLGLLLEIRKTFGGDGESANSDTGHAAVLDMCNYPTDLVRVMHLEAVHFRCVQSYRGMHLGQKSHGGVVEQPCRDRRAFDIPALVS